MYSVLNNFYSRYVNGNIKSRGIKLAHYNKGNASMFSRMTEIKQMIDMHRPLILGISEANIKTNEDINLYSIKDYKIFPAPASVSGVIRLVVYVHKEISVKLRNDLMCPGLSSVWLEAGYKNTKSS